MWPLRDAILSARTYADLPDRRVVFNPFPKRRIVSFGTIVYCRATQRWLLVRVGMSYAFSNLLMGVFQKSDLPTLVAHMTAEEVRLLRGLYHGSVAWRDVYRGSHAAECEARFQQHRDMLRPYIAHTAPVSLTTPWSFPKGRTEAREAPMQCALREFEEETGLPAALLGAPVVHETISERYTSYDHVVYETKCWVFALDGPEPALVQPADNEIEERRWCDEAEARALLSASKADMLEQAKRVLGV